MLWPPATEAEWAADSARGLIGWQQLANVVIVISLLDRRMQPGGERGGRPERAEAAVQHAPADRGVAAARCGGW